MKILIVDDEKIEREGIRFLINMHKLDLIAQEAENGEKALECLKDGFIDILFTDIKMPFMDGLELAEKARAANPDIKIILFSAYSEFEYARQAIKLDVDYYLLKPINIDEFLKIMHEVMEACRLQKAKKEEEELLLQVYRKVKVNEIDKDPTLDSARYKGSVAEVISIIQKEYALDISLEYLAEKVFLTPSYLSCLFSKETGQSVVKYITNYRLEVAKKLLTDTQMKIIDISKNVGYINTSYFCSLFKNYFGVPPGHYRERV